jgi:hypothetical protein
MLVNSVTEVASKPIRYIELNWKIQPLTDEEKVRREIPIVRRSRVSDLNRVFLLAHYEQYGDRHACDICEREHKANHVVKLIDEALGEELRSGLGCLYKQFGITDKDIKKTTNMQVGLLSIVSGVLGRNINSTAEGPTVIQEELIRLAGTDAPAVNSFLASLREMQNNIEGFSRGQYNPDLRAAVDFLSLLREREQYPHIFTARWKALRNHPLVKSNLFEFDAVLEQPERKLFPNQVKELFNLLRGVEKQQIPLRNQGVYPWEFSSHDAYIEALRQHYHERSNTARPLPDNFPAKGSVLRSYTQKLPSCVVIGMDMYDFIPGVFASQQEVDQLKKQFPDLECYRSEVEHERVKFRKKDSKDQVTQYRVLALWVPDAWKATYGLWKEFGRDLLENPYSMFKPAK